MSLNGQMMQVNDVNLNVLVEGEGEPVVLLHGFPDSNYVWRDVIPLLVDGGYKVIAPDQRGYGQSDAPEGKENYDMDVIASDTIAILDQLGIDKARLVGHDWGGWIGWNLAILYPERFKDYISFSTGHPAAYSKAGMEQKKKGWYVVFFQLEGLTEKVLMANDWQLFRKSVGEHPEMDHWVEDMSRPGRLTATINWYRQNFGRIYVKGDFGRVKIPSMGVFSTNDLFLNEKQMIDSASFVDATWQYERIEDVSHWIPIDIPEKTAEIIMRFHARD